MGSILSKIYDNYEAYEKLCEYLNVTPKDIYSYYTHEEELRKEHKFEKTYFGYQKKEKKR